MTQEEVQNGVGKNGATAAATAVALKVLFKPQLLVQAPKATDAVQFYKAAFDAEEVGRVVHPKRKAEQELPLILSTDLKLGAFVFSVADSPEDAAQAKTEGGSVVFCLETEDLDGVIAKAVEAGAVAEGEVTEDEVAGGMRVGKLKDPFGFTWAISAAKRKPAEVEA